MKHLVAGLFMICAIGATGAGNAADGRVARPQHFDADAGFVSRTLREGRFLRFADATGENLNLNELTGRMPQSFEIACDTIAVRREDGESPLALATRVMAMPHAGAVVAVVADGADAPSIAAYPEDRLAVLNIDRLRLGLPADEGAEVFKKRLLKELWRAAAFAMGGYESDYPCALKAAFSMDDIDANPIEMTCPPVSGHIRRSGERLGFGRVQCVPYFLALRQGWAPEPANDAQRAEKERYERILASRREKEAEHARDGAEAR